MVILEQYDLYFLLNQYSVWHQNKKVGLDPKGLLKSTILDLWFP